MKQESAKERWKNPRETIAQKFFNNDYGYMFHGCMQLVEFLSSSEFTINELGSKKILDYGCGTGRLARLLALAGGTVDGYDPTEECIAEAMNEEKLVEVTKRKPRIFTSDLSKLGKNYDIILAVNVLEHLTQSEFDEAIENITALLKEGGVCFLWVPVKGTPLEITGLDTLDSKKRLTIIRGQKINNTIPVYEVLVDLQKGTQK